MRNISLFKIFIISGFFLFAFLNQVIGQNVYLKTSVNEVTVCGENATFSIEVRNLNAPGGNVFGDVVVQSQLPSGVMYVGELSPNATLNIEHSTAKPAFDLGTIAGGESKTFTFAVKAGCDLVQYIRDNNQPGNNLVNNITQMRYNVVGQSNSPNRTYFEPSGSDSYNVKYATIQLKVGADVKNQSLVRGDLAVRTFTVTNTGTGPVSGGDLTIEITNDRSGLSLQSLTGTEHTKTTIGNTTLVTISDFSKGWETDNLDSDNLFEPGESFTLTETVKLQNCSNVDINTNYFAKWGCGDQICNLNSNNSQDGSNISIISGDPWLKSEEISNSSMNFCGDPINLKFEYINYSSSTSNLEKRANTLFNVVLQVNKSNDFTVYSDFKILNKHGSYVSISPISSPYMNDYLEFDASAFANIEGGVEGLDDIDGDGETDDLVPQNKITLTANITLTCTSDEFSQFKPGYNRRFFHSYINGTNSCDEFASSYSNITGTAYENSTFTSQNIDGPVDLIDTQEGIYTFSIDRNFGGIHNNNTFFSSKINFPSSAYDVESVRWIGSNVPVTWEQGEDGTLNIEGGGWKGSYEVAVTMKCNSTGEVPPSSVIEWEMYRSYSTNKCCLDVIAKESFEVFNHCFGSGSGNGVVCLRTTDFDVERTSFGYSEPAIGYYTTLPSTTVGKNDDVRIDAAMETDNIQAIAKGFVSGGSVNNAYVRIQYESPVGDDLLEYIDGYFEVKVGSTPNVQLPSSPPLVLKEGSTISYVFKLENYSTLNSGDQINLYSNFKIKKHTSIPLGETKIRRFRAFHFSLDEDNSELGCESFGALFTLVKVRFSGFNISSGDDFNCFGKGADLRLFLLSYGVLGQDPFPNEFRPNTKIDQISLEMPLNFEFNAVRSVIDYLGTPDASMPLGVPSITNLPNGNLLYSWNSFPYVDPASKNDRINIFITFEPKCLDEIPGNFVSISEIDYSNYAFSNQPQKLKSQMVSRYSKRRPVLNLSANTIQDGFKENVTWEVNICNTETSYYSTSEMTWFTFEPPANLNLLTATYNGTTLKILNLDTEESHKKLVEIGRVSNNSCKTITLTATYVDCIEDVVDDIAIFTGYGCGGYPVDPKEITCNNPTITEGLLQLRYKNADLATTIHHEEKKYNLCEAIPYEVEILSSGQGDMDDIHLLLTNSEGNELPTGIEIISGSVQYQFPDSNPGTWIDLTVAPKSITTDKMTGFGWNLSNSVLKGDPFSRTERMLVRFSLEAGCNQAPESNFDPGVPILINVEGRTNCNDVLVRTFQSKIEINGFSLAGEDLIPNVLTNNVCAKDESPTVFFSVTNPGLRPSIAQDLLVKLPKEFVYEGIPSGAPTPSSVRVLMDGSTEVTWKLYAGIAAGGTIDGFGLVVNVPEGSVVSTVEIETRTIIFGEGTCISTGEPCPLKATTGFSRATVAIAYEVCVECPEANLSISAECVGKNTSFTANFTEEVAGAEILWSFGDGTTSNEISPLHTYAAPGNYEVKLTLTGPGDCEILEEQIISITTCYSCEECIPSFSPLPGQQYVLSAWVKEGTTNTVSTYEKAVIELEFRGTEEVLTFAAEGAIIDGWQRIETAFTIPEAASDITVKLRNLGSGEIYFDDIRIHPFNANMKSFVYDPVSLRLMAELDENNYATFYEYDEEGALVRIKKETERGVKTIQESRNHTIKVQ